MILKMVSATTSQCFIKATDKNKVNLAERLSSFAQVTGNPTQMDLQLQLHLMQTDQPMPTPNEEDGRLPKPVSGLSWMRAAGFIWDSCEVWHSRKAARPHTQKVWMLCWTLSLGMVTDFVEFGYVLGT